MVERLVLPGTANGAVNDIVNGLTAGRRFHVVNFHATPRYRQAEFLAQIKLYAERFEPVTPENLDMALFGPWPHARPGLMPVLFEGYRDNLDVILPILEGYGFCGWLFVPSFFLGVPISEQRQYAAEHSLHLPARDEYNGGRIALTWDEARAIVKRGHRFACHSRHHTELRPDTSRDVLEEEIVIAKQEMERELGESVDIFCWLRGAQTGVNPVADELLRKAGYKYLFSNFKIEKLA
jgi:peptidoglycan/xylan/chitin deacetylase (PgdA/CDA1 family)